LEYSLFFALMVLLFCFPVACPGCAGRDVTSGLLSVFRERFFFSGRPAAPVSKILPVFSERLARSGTLFKLFVRE